MPREFTRNDRVSDALQRELAELIRDEVRDPRLTMVNILAVEVNRDLSNAKVYVSFVGTDSEDESKEAAGGFKWRCGILAIPAGQADADANHTTVTFYL